MSKVSKVNIEGQEYSFLTGQAVEASCSTAGSSYVKILSFNEETDVVPGMLLSVHFSSGNTAGFEGTKTIYSSDGVSFFYNQAMTQPVILPPSDCYSIEHIEDTSYEYSEWVVFSINNEHIPLYNSEGSPCGGPLWSNGALVTFVCMSDKIMLMQAKINVTDTVHQGNKLPVSSDAVYRSVSAETNSRIAAVSAEATARDTAIANAITSLLSKIATQFLPSSTYVKDNYVSYNGSIYRCTASSHTGAWSAGDFTEVNLANDLMQIIQSMSGGSKMDINEIAELFNINKNPENVNALSGGSAIDLYNEYGIKLPSLANYSVSGYIGEDLVYAENSGTYCYLIDMRNGIIYIDKYSNYLPFGKNWFVNNGCVQCLKCPNAGIDYEGGSNIKSQVYDGGRAFVYIGASGNLYYALLASGSQSSTFHQTLDGITCNNVINAKGKFVITTNSGTYISDGNWSTLTRVHTSASSHACFGKNKFAMLVGGTVYFSEDALNWNATGMSGMNELYFSCGKFVARNSSGNIYYSDDLSEWKQSPITTTSGIFTDTVFMWNKAYYTRDFVNIITLKVYSDSNGYPQSAFIGGYSWESYQSSIYYQGSQLADTGSNGSYITSYGAIISDRDRNYVKYVALKLVQACGDWLRRPLN